MSRHDHLQVIALLVSERMEDIEDFDDVFCVGNTVNFGFDGVQYIMSFTYDYYIGYNCTLCNYQKEVGMHALVVGKMLLGDFQELKPLCMCT